MTGQLNSVHFGSVTEKCDITVPHELLQMIHLSSSAMIERWSVASALNFYMRHSHGRTIADVLIMGRTRGKEVIATPGEQVFTEGFLHTDARRLEV